MITLYTPRLYCDNKDNVTLRWCSEGWRDLAAFQPNTIGDTGLKFTSNTPVPEDLQFREQPAPPTERKYSCFLCYNPNTNKAIVYNRLRPIRNPRCVLLIFIVEFSKMWLESIYWVWLLCSRCLEINTRGPSSG